MFLFLKYIIYVVETTLKIVIDEKTRLMINFDRLNRFIKTMSNYTTVVACTVLKKIEDNSLMCFSSMQSTLDLLDFVKESQQDSFCVTKGETSSNKLLRRQETGVSSFERDPSSVSNSLKSK